MCGHGGPGLADACAGAVPLGDDLDLVDVPEGCIADTYHICSELIGLMCNYLEESSDTEAALSRCKQLVRVGILELLAPLVWVLPNTNLLRRLQALSVFLMAVYDDVPSMLFLVALIAQMQEEYP